MSPPSRGEQTDMTTPSGAQLDMADACNIPCNTPPPAVCIDAKTLRWFSPQGICPAGQCTYLHTDAQCESGCANGACISSDPCSGVQCITPPAATCSDSNTLVCYEAMGTCSAGKCRYTSMSVTCQNGCQRGACSGDPCAGVMCHSPPASYCTNASTLRSYAASGSCDAGNCVYAATDTECASGCGAGACCTCPSGFSCNGTSTTCGGGDVTALSLNVPSVPVSGVITLNGDTPTSTCNSVIGDKATITFTTDQVLTHTSIACTTGSSFAFSYYMLPDTYGIQVNGEMFSNLPNGQVGFPSLKVEKPITDLVLNVTTQKLAGTVTVNGGPAKGCASGQTAGYLQFCLTASSEPTTLPIVCGSGGALSFSGAVPRGTHRVSIVGSGGANLPLTPTVVSPAMVVQSDQLALAWDVASVAVAGVITQNGSAPTSTCSDPDLTRASITFTENATQSQASVGISCAAMGFAFSAYISPGTYSVSVQSTGSSLPTAEYMVNSALAAQSDLTNLTLDVPSFEVSGTVTVNGHPPTGICTTSSATTATTMGALALSGPDNTIRAFVPIFCNPGTAPTFSATLLPGDYSIAINSADRSTNLPDFFGQPLLSQLHVAGAVSGLALDTPAVSLSGTITFDGQQSSTCTGDQTAIAIFFHSTTNRARGEMLVPCAPGGLSFSGAAPPGTYRVTVEGQASAFPQAGYTLPTPFTVTKDQTGIIWNVPTRHISGTLTVNGMNPVGACTAGTSVGGIYFDGNEGIGYTNFFVPLFCSPNGPLTFSATVFPGTYAVLSDYWSNLNLPRASRYYFARSLAVP
jgi:hypothetical protein